MSPTDNGTSNTFSGHSSGSVVQASTINTVVINSTEGLAPAGSPLPWTPRQLPADVARFVDREAILSSLTARLDDPPPPHGPLVFLAGGVAGVGKTTFAVHWSHRVKSRFPDGQLYVNLRGFDPEGIPMTPAEAIRTLLDGLRVAPDRIPAGIEAQFALYRSLLVDKRILVVLDNAQDATLVRQLLPSSPTAVVLVTSRMRLLGLAAKEGVRPVNLEILNDKDAAALLAHHVGSERAESEQEAVSELARLCGGLPLALSVVGARAALRPNFPLSTLVDELRDERERLAAIETGELDTDPRAVFSWSYRTLSDDAKRLFRFAGLHHGPDIGLHAAASLLGEGIPRTRRLMAELISNNLINERAPGRFEYHDLLRLYAAELARETDPRADRHVALGRLLDHYLYSADNADQHINPIGNGLALEPVPVGVTVDSVADETQALTWFSTEHANLNAALNLAEREGFEDHCWRLDRALRHFFDHKGHWLDWQNASEIALRAGQRRNDEPVQGYAEVSLALAHTLLGDEKQALYYGGTALSRFEELGEASGRAYAHQALRFVHGQNGRFEQALTRAAEAVELFRATGERKAYAAALASLAWCHSQRRDFAEAIAHASEGLRVAHEVKNATLEVMQLDILGSAHRGLRECDTAVDYYRRYVELYQHLGSEFYAARGLHSLGDTYQEKGDLEAAREAWSRALEPLERHNHPEADNVRAKLADHAPEG